MTTNKKTSKSGGNVNKTATAPSMSANKKHHSGPTIAQVERQARGQVKITVRTTTEVRDRAAELLGANPELTHGAIYEAGLAAIEATK